MVTTRQDSEIARERNTFLLFHRNRRVASSFANLLARKQRQTEDRQLTNPLRYAEYHKCNSIARDYFDTFT